MALVDRAGRRPLLLLGVGGCAAALNTAALLFAFHVESGIGLLVPLLLHVACFAFSFGAIGWIVISQLFPDTIRGRAAGFVTYVRLGYRLLYLPVLAPLSENLGAPASLASMAAPLPWRYCLLSRWSRKPKGKPSRKSNSSGGDLARHTALGMTRFKPDPDSDSPRLAYAHWLAEHGDAWS